MYSLSLANILLPKIVCYIEPYGAFSTMKNKGFQMSSALKACYLSIAEKNSIE